MKPLGKWTSRKMGAMMNRLSFLVGRDRTGQWLVIERHGLGGGIFRSRAAALAYASAECGRRPGAVRVTRKLLSFPF